MRRGRVQLRHVLAAADESDEGRAAIIAAAVLGQETGARVGVLTVIQPGEDEEGGARALEALRGRVREALRHLPEPPRVEAAIARGLPGIEIGRLAETIRADLVVIGRKQRSSRQRLLVGDTADSVARRSPIPCLYIPAEGQRFRRVLVALDGSERGMGVLVPAMAFTRATGARLRAISVEPAHEGENDLPRILTARSSKLLELVNGRRVGVDLGIGRWEETNPGGTEGPVVIRRGRIVDEIVHEVETYRADVLVVGYHRGGPAGPIEAGSVARRLIHEAPCAVLTIPL
jgi:nucleotide-binding universal stress UspA family protein